jgi:hypothetical protein
MYWLYSQNPRVVLTPLSVIELLSFLLSFKIFHDGEEAMLYNDNDEWVHYDDPVRQAYIDGHRELYW